MKANLLAVLLLLATVGMFIGCSQSGEKEGEATPGEMESAPPAEWVTTESGLQYKDIVVGDGAEAVSGAQVEVHYTGWLWEDTARGNKFDSSHDRATTFTFTLGAGQVISGWDEGVAGMKVGGIRELLIPAELGYGARGAGNVIPPNATLDFEVELISISGG